MCKIAVVPFTNNTDLTMKLIKKLRPKMTSHDDHGYGIASVQGNGADANLSVARWLEPKNAFDFEIDAAPPIPNAVLLDRAFEGSKLNPNQVKSIIAHARYATTGDKTIINTHPFTYDQTALIHNGVINNASDLVNLTSTCDSETILNAYVEANVSADPKNIDKVVEKLSGWFACAVITKDADDRWVLDVFKDGSTSLVVTTVKVLGSPVFCTSREMLDQALRELKMKHGAFYAVPQWSITRFDIEAKKVSAFYNMTARPQSNITSLSNWDAYKYSITAAQLEEEDNKRWEELDRRVTSKV